MQPRNTNNTVLIDHFQQVEYISSLFTINLKVYEHSYNITIQLAHITFQQLPNYFLQATLSNSILYIMDCQFLSNDFPLFLINDDSDNSSMTFINCKFLNNTTVNPLIDTNCINVIIINCAFNGNVNILHSNIFSSSNKTTVVIENTQFNYNILNDAYEGSLIETRYVDVTIVNCSFNGNLNIVLRLYGYDNDKNATVVIKNTQFVNILFEDYNSLLILTYSNLLLEGVVTFCGIINQDSIIELNEGSTITVHGRVKFSNIIANQLIYFVNNHNRYIKIKDLSVISIHHNQVRNFFVTFQCERILYPFCIFQYYTNRTLENGNFLIKTHDSESRGQEEAGRTRDEQVSYLHVAPL